MGQYNIKNIREEFKSKGIFYLPALYPGRRSGGGSVFRGAVL